MICRGITYQIQKRETERKEKNVDSERPVLHISVTSNLVGIEGNVVYKVGVNDEWLNVNGLKGEVVKYSRYYPGNDVERLRKTTRSHDSPIPTVIRTRHIRNKSLKHYRYDNLFDVLLSLS